MTCLQSHSEYIAEPDLNLYLLPPVPGSEHSINVKFCCFCLLWLSF